MRYVAPPFPLAADRLSAKRATTNRPAVGIGARLTRHAVRSGPLAGPRAPEQLPRGRLVERYVRNDALELGLRDTELT